MNKRLLSILLTLCMVLMLCPVTAFADEHVYRVAGQAELCGSTWDATDDNNRMTYNEETGRFKKVYTDVAANPTGYEYKIVVDGATWIPAGSGSNQTVYVEEDNATVTIWYDENTGEWGADVAYDTPAEQSQYTITYDGGEGVEGSITAGTKTPGEDFTLSSNTFTRDGYIQIGWEDKEGKRYELGGTYSQNADMTFYPVWDEILTLSVPFTTTVEVSGNASPGETTFNLEVVNSQGNELQPNDYNVKITASVETDGAGDYNGNLTFTGTASAILRMFDNERDEYGYIYVKQAGVNDSNWDVDEAAWGLFHRSVVDLSDEEVEPSPIYIFPAVKDGTSYSVEYGENGVDKMTFVNKYASSAVDPSDSEGTTNGEADKDSKADNEDSAKTGDDTNLALWLALMLLAGAGITGTTIYTRRKRTNE